MLLLSNIESEEGRKVRISFQSDKYSLSVIVNECIGQSIPKVDFKNLAFVVAEDIKPVDETAAYTPLKLLILRRLILSGETRKKY